MIINRCVEQNLSVFAFSLDELLDGGLYTGELTEIVGAAGVGKSQVISTLISRILVNNLGE